MPPSSGELWGYSLMPKTILVDCLLPNGLLVVMECLRDATLEKIKTDLWKAAKKLPGFGRLGDMTSYVFESVVQDAEREEFYDETRKLCDLKLFMVLLRVVEQEGNIQEKKINFDIGIAIGRPVHELEQLPNPEVHECRRSLVVACQEVVQFKESLGVVSNANIYSPELESSPELPSTLDGKLDRGMLILSVWLLNEDGKQKYTVQVAKDVFPSTVIAEVVMKKMKSMKCSRDKLDRVIAEHQETCILKLCGCDEYLFLDNHPLSQYKCIRRMIAKGHRPQIAMVNRSEVFVRFDNTPFHVPQYMKRSPPPPIGETRCLWTLNGKLKVKVLSATYVNVKESDQIYVKLGMFNGPERLCPEKNTVRVTARPRWDEWLELDIDVSDIPRNAKLCASICSVSVRSKKREDHCLVAWGNIQIFDYRNIMVTEKVSTNLWPCPRGIQDDLLIPLGVSGGNPNTDAPCLELEFEMLGVAIEYPDQHVVSALSDQVTMNERAARARDNKVISDPVSPDDLEQIKQIAKRDPLTELPEQEKELLWRLRRQCWMVPDILPRLLDSVKWNSKEEVAQLYTLLNAWPQVSPETALELLDCKYADMAVRRRAVQWLDRSLTDDKLNQYLLQLVQTLKYEAYLNNPLSHFLLKRALLNRRIGHYFFWHLRAEMHSPQVNLRFSLLLEAFCRGCCGHRKTFLRQVEALDKLVCLTENFKERPNESAKDIEKLMAEKVSQSDFLEALQEFPSPLDSSSVLGALIISDCHVMDSSKKPLWLVWSNPDPMADVVFLPKHMLIFKNGDDLRQDMLTLQVIRIMDDIWRDEGMDLRMLPYSCLATGKQVGLIEVVRSAKTVYAIQRQSKLAAIQVDSTKLHKWIKEKNKEPAEYEKAVEVFTHSCAGYCVATFILGIGDRNPDNIMVNEEGQIFHIDFGHFLGHFKKKFGISRERVPFVLTDDFLCVIAKGSNDPKRSKEFEMFQELCGQAYRALRRHANLLITLFTMMLSSEIPELQSIEDVGYLRKTLAVELNEQEAVMYFQNQFSEAYGGAWTTKLDWFFHSVKHM